MAATVNGHEYTFTDFVGTDGKDYSRTNTDTGETQFPDSVMRDMVAELGGTNPATGVTLNGHSYSASAMIGSDGRGYAATSADTGLVVFPDSVFKDMLLEIADKCALTVSAGTAITVNGHAYQLSDFVGSDGLGYVDTHAVTGETLFPDSILIDVVPEFWTARWQMSSQTSTNGALIDYSGGPAGSMTIGHGHHGWYGGVKKALIGDTTSGDRGLILPGIAGNYASVPDAAALDITGDIEIQCYARMTDWTPSGEQALVTKYAGADTKRSYKLSVTATTGLLTLKWTTDGLVGTILSADSTVAPTVANGAALWVKVTMDVDDGSGNRVIKFYTSADGSTWTQLGDTVTTAGTTSIYSSGQPVEIGAGGTTGDENLLVGTIYRAIIKSGIGGTTVLDVDFTTQAQGTRSFTCTTGQTVTENQAGTSTAEPQLLWYSGTAYGWLPGTAGNYFSVPDSAGVQPTDIDVRCAVAMNDWTPSADAAIAAKIKNGTNREWYLLVKATTGVLNLSTTSDGSTGTLISVDSSAAPTVVDGAILAIRATRDVDNGSGNRVTSFYTKATTEATAYADCLADTGWSALGTTTTTAGTTSIFNSDSPVEFGSSVLGTSNLWGGKLYAFVQKELDGTVLLAENLTAAASYNATYTTLTAVTGQTVTINRSATGLKTWIVAANEEQQDGSDDYRMVDDQDRLDVGATDSFTVAKRCRIYQTPAAEGVLIGKKSGIAAANAGWQITVDTSRRAVFRVSDGTDAATSTSAALTAGAEVIIAGVLNRTANTVTVYVNGVAAATGDASAVGALSNAVTMRTGCDGAGANFLSHFGRSEAVFRRALTATQVSNLSSLI